MYLGKTVVDLVCGGISHLRPRLKNKITAIRSRPPAQLQAALGLQSKKAIDLDIVTKKIKWLIPEHLLRNAIFIVLAIFTSLIGFSLCVTYLNNFGAGIVCIAAVILIFIQIFTYATTKDRREINNQLPAVARIFGSVMEDTGSFRLALDAVADRSPEPARSLFIKITQMLDHGIESDKAFEEIPKAAGTGYATLLKDLMLDAYKYGTIVLPRFTRLAGQIDTMQELQNENTPDVAASRFTAIILHIGIIIMAFLTVRIAPDAKKYLTDDPIGKIIVTAIFLSVVIGIIADRLWGDVSD
ncbi:type II secretion system F family protein [Desulfoscipio geothermicus]|nr:hypothetical protein [Desulfoscipio geothermicus]